MPLPAIERTVESSDGTRKLLLVWPDGARAETVVIPTPRRTTVCVSTQTFCARGCVFCVTATLPRGRSLSALEIVSQVALAAALPGLPPVRNVVYMGMGEPLDNLAATQESVARLVDQRTFRIAPRHVTVSTVGTTPALVRQLVDLEANIAWSLHSADPVLRRHLVPTARGALEGLREAFVETMGTRGDLLFVEVTLLAGVNDSPAQAEALADFLTPFGKGVRVNVLPMNPGRGRYVASMPATIAVYRQVLQGRGYVCTLRRERGAAEGAACGQLGAAGA